MSNNSKNKTRKIRKIRKTYQKGVKKTSKKMYKRTKRTKRIKRIKRIKRTKRRKTKMKGGVSSGLTHLIKLAERGKKTDEERELELINRRIQLKSDFVSDGRLADNSVEFLVSDKDFNGSKILIPYGLTQKEYTDKLDSFNDMDLNKILVAPFKLEGDKLVMASGSHGNLRLAIYNGEICSVKTIANTSDKEIFNEINIHRLLTHKLSMRSRGASRLYFPDMKAVFEDDANKYILMEYIDPPVFMKQKRLFHSELTHLIEGQIEFENIQKYMLQISEALAYMHSFNLMHGDLKAENILIDNKGNVRIIDFGNARLVIEEDSPSSSNPLTCCVRDLGDANKDYELIPEYTERTQKHTGLQNLTFGQSADWFVVGTLLIQMAAATIDMGIYHHIVHTLEKEHTIDQIFTLNINQEAGRTLASEEKRRRTEIENLFKLGQIRQTVATKLSILQVENLCKFAYYLFLHQNDRACATLNPNLSGTELFWSCVNGSEKGKSGDKKYIEIQRAVYNFFQEKSPILQSGLEPEGSTPVAPQAGAEAQAAEATESLKEWLTNIHLEQWHDALVDAGFDHVIDLVSTLEETPELFDTTLNGIGIPPPHLDALRRATLNDPRYVPPKKKA